MIYSYRISRILIMSTATHFGGAIGLSIKNPFVGILKINTLTDWPVPSSDISATDLYWGPAA